MHKAILMMLLTIVSSSAMAEWVKVGTTNKYTFYADPDTIRKKGNIVKMWILFDFNSTHEGATAGHKYLSSKSQDEFDCKEEQRKLLYFSRHSKNMGGGDVAYTCNEPEMNWSPVAPDSVGKDLWKFACGK